MPDRGALGTTSLKAINATNQTSFPRIVSGAHFVTGLSMPAFAMMELSSVVSSSSPSALAALAEILPARATWEFAGKIGRDQSSRQGLNWWLLVLRTICLAWVMSPSRSVKAPVIAWPAIFSSFCFSLRTAAAPAR